jgi:hypothetical protein
MQNRAAVAAWSPPIGPWPKVTKRGGKQAAGPAVLLSVDRALSWVIRRREHIRKYGLAAALLIFTLGLVWALRAMPHLMSRLSLGHFLLLLVVGAPIGTTLSSIELYAVSRIAGGPMTWRTSFDVTVYGSAANLLPVPGAALARLAAMKAHGVGYGVGSAMIVLSFAIWGGLAFLYSAAGLLMLGKSSLAAAFAVCGLALLALSALGYARFRNWKLVAVLALSRIISFPLEAFRYLLALLTIGVSVSYLQSSIYVVASFIGSAVIFAPTGLGVSEAAASFLSTLVGVSAAAGFMAATVGRVARLTGLAGVAATLFLLGRKPPGEVPSPGYSGSV